MLSRKRRRGCRRALPQAPEPRTTSPAGCGGPGHSGAPAGLYRDNAKPAAHRPPGRPDAAGAPGNSYDFFRMNAGRTTWPFLIWTM